MRIMELASREAEPRVRDRLIREAFDALFHAARIASMAYLSTEESRWGYLGRMLPENFRDEFRRFIDTLHIEYFYNGSYPREETSEEFERGLNEVEDYVKKMEAEATRS
ncbi:MAG: hypothetical protein ACE5Z5_01525 [Candidatus Bathyarchaeia archaeon]